MLAKYAVGYLATGIAFALIDSIWLRTMYTRLYQPELGPLLGSLKLGPAVVFYLLYIAGMMWFAVAPALANGRSGGVGGRGRGGRRGVLIRHPPSTGSKARQSLGVCSSKYMSCLSLQLP